MASGKGTGKTPKSPPADTQMNAIEPEADNVASPPKPNKRKRGRTSSNNAELPTKTKKNRPIVMNSGDSVTSQGSIARRSARISARTAGLSDDESMTSQGSKTRKSTRKSARFKAPKISPLKELVEDKKEEHSPSIPREVTTVKTLPQLSLQLPSETMKDSKAMEQPSSEPTKTEITNTAKSYIGRKRLQSIQTPAKPKPPRLPSPESMPVAVQAIKPAPVSVPTPEPEKPLLLLQPLAEVSGAKTMLENKYVEEKTKIEEEEDATQLQNGISSKVSHALQPLLNTLDTKQPNDEPVIEDDEDRVYDSPIYTKRHFWILLFCLINITIFTVTGFPYIEKHVATFTNSYSPRVLSLFGSLHEKPDDSLPINTTMIPSESEDETCAMDTCEEESLIEKVQIESEIEKTSKTAVQQQEVLEEEDESPIEEEQLESEIEKTSKTAVQQQEVLEEEDDSLVEEEQEELESKTELQQQEVLEEEDESSIEEEQLESEIEETPKTVVQQQEVLEEEDDSLVEEEQLGSEIEETPKTVVQQQEVLEEEDDSLVEEEQEELESKTELQQQEVLEEEDDSLVEEEQEELRSNIENDSKTEVQQQQVLEEEDELLNAKEQEQLESEMELQQQKDFEEVDEALIEKEQEQLEAQIEKRMKDVVQQQQVLEKEKKNIDAMKKVLDSPSTKSILSSSSAAVDTDFDSSALDEHIQEQDEKLKIWEEKLEEAEKAMEEVENSAYQKLDTLVEKMTELDNVASIPVATSLFDESIVEIPGEGCEAVENVNLDKHEKETSYGEEVEKEYLLRSEFDEKKEYILELAQSTASDLISDPTLFAAVRTWVEKAVQSAQQHYGLAKIQELKMEEPMKQEETGISRGAIQSQISEVLEIVAADGTGKRDYASIEAGASVIRNGNRKTSPSLVDSLPIGNRILAALKLRFYGHQAEAALRETYPKYALGQCWSFEEDKLSNKLEETAGKFGTLSVNLPNDVNVESIMIEHPSREITESVGTAIRSFRVIGYSDEDAMGYPWDLGSFLYDINASSSDQEFKVSSDVLGTDVPSLRSITLAIDSNWGEDYSCLYRFRIHGTM